MTTEQEFFTSIRAHIQSHVRMVYTMRRITDFVRTEYEAVKTSPSPDGEILSFLEGFLNRLVKAEIGLMERGTEWVFKAIDNAYGLETEPTTKLLQEIYMFYKYEGSFDKFELFLETLRTAVPERVRFSVPDPIPPNRQDYKKAIRHETSKRYAWKRRGFFVSAEDREKSNELLQHMHEVIEAFWDHMNPIQDPEPKELARIAEEFFKRIEDAWIGETQYRFYYLGEGDDEQDGLDPEIA